MATASFPPSGQRLILGKKIQIAAYLGYSQETLL
jgi:hypothetical protein